MLDINLIREQPEWVKARLATRHDETLAARIDAVLELDQRRRALLVQGETLQAERNKLNKALGRMKGNRKLSLAAQAYALQEAVRAIEAEDFARAVSVLTDPPEAAPDPNAQPDLAALTDALRRIGDRVEALTKQAEAVEAEMRDHMLWLPNLPHESVPLGASSADNPIGEVIGTLPRFSFTPKPHWELGPELDVIDFERGVKLSGSRFYMLKGMGARLQRALINFCLDQHVANGYTELYLPFIVKEEMLYGAGQFPKFRNEIYADLDAALYLLPTAEVAITNLHRDEILNAADLPLRYVANTPCWRREATSAGRDVRGIKRVHQFQKVELYQFSTPERSYEVHEAMRAEVERLCALLEMPYRVVTLCTGDLGFGMAKTYDIEVYAAGCDEWLEVSSISNAEAFQARRAMIRYRPEGGGKVEYVHTLNGSGLAMPRVIIAILENFQQADGSVVVPKVLRPYLGGLEIIAPR
ncbi:MAG: serine--tRNA ligase [Chloroflexota bacterium]|jgi:seryl-tRNA synthetase|nr:MAG: serine--tRNA ligase [Chloroflexota bacterium]